MIFVLTIAASAIFICMMGSSYAYYTATATDISVTTGTINNGISVVFTDNNYVNVKTGVPLDDEQVMEYAKANTFSIMPDATTLEGYDVYVNISLINVKIDDALKVSDFKQEIKSDKTGVITNIKALNIGKLSCSLGAGRINKEDTIDYGVGIILNKQVGDVVNIGDTLFTLYKKNNDNINLNISEYYEIN